MGFLAGLAAQHLWVAIAILAAIVAAPLSVALLKVAMSVIAVRNAAKGAERSTAALRILAMLTGQAPEPPPADPTVPPVEAPPPPPPVP